MKLARTSLAALAVLTVYACSTDATAPEISSDRNTSTPRIGAPGGPLFDGGSVWIGSGTKTSTDSVNVVTSDSTAVAEPE